MAMHFCLQWAASELHLVDVENLLGTPWFTSHGWCSRRVRTEQSAPCWLK